MRYVPLITNLINETSINIYYIHYHLHTIIYLLHIINKMNQTIWTPRFLRGNPVTGEKTTEASLTPKIYFAKFNPGWGNNPLQFTLPSCRWKENKEFVYTITSRHQPEGAPTPTSLLCRP